MKVDVGVGKGAESGTQGFSLYESTKSLSLMELFSKSHAMNFPVSQ